MLALEKTVLLQIHPSYQSCYQAAYEWAARLPNIPEYVCLRNYLQVLLETTDASMVEPVRIYVRRVLLVFNLNAQQVLAVPPQKHTPFRGRDVYYA